MQRFLVCRTPRATANLMRMFSSSAASNPVLQESTSMGTPLPAWRGHLGNESDQSVKDPTRDRHGSVSAHVAIAARDTLRKAMEDEDLKLGEFIDMVKTELWQYDSMLLRRRFRVQSLLRRLQTPPFETWSHSLSRASASSSRPFTRTLLAKHEGASAVQSSASSAPGFDLLILCWRPGAESVIHNHPKAGCWVKILKGQVRETRYTEDVNGREGKSGGLVQTSDTLYSSGSVTYMEDSMGYHKMTNASETEECISLHLYSPGITECSTWSDCTSSEPVRSFMSVDGSFMGPISERETSRSQ